MGTTDDAEPQVVGGAQQIRAREFATVRRGYDPTQVRSYLQLVSDKVDALERALTDARARVTELEAELRAAEEASTGSEAYEELSKRFANVLVAADSEAAHLVEQARAEAEHIKTEAKARAEEARMRSSQALFAAREESERLAANLAERRAAMLSQLHEMQSRLLSVASDLEVAIEPPSLATPSPPELRHPEPDPELDLAGPELPDLSMLDFDLDDDRDAEG
jgi:DivIVA domain-containing protein